MTFNELKKLYDKSNALGLEHLTKQNAYAEKKGGMLSWLDYEKTKESRELRAKIKQANRDFYVAFDEYEKENGLVYTNKKWITKIYGDFIAYEDNENKPCLELARKSLLEKLSKMNGVKVINDKNGVKTIEVKTKDKIYYYSIHAYYCCEKIGEEEYIGLAGNTCKRDITRNGCQGCVYKNTFNALRNKFKDFEEMRDLRKEKGIE